MITEALQTATSVAAMILQNKRWKGWVGKRGVGF
jgi:hypothetical protein